jgi:single stranded DNA-binding protein
MRGLEVACWGTLGKDPETRISKAGNSFCVLSVGVAVGHDDQDRDVLQWLKAVCFKEVAETIAARATKGSKVYLEGALTIGEYTTKEGEKRTSLDVRAWRVDLVGASGSLGKNRPKRTDQGGTPSFAGSVYQREKPGIVGRHDFHSDALPF